VGFTLAGVRGEGEHGDTGEFAQVVRRCNQDTPMIPSTLTVFVALRRSRLKAKTLADIAEALASADPYSAARLTADAERIARSISDEILKAATLADVASALAVVDADRAAAVFVEVETIVLLVADGDQQAWALPES
jgi:hypothetical protein